MEVWKIIIPIVVFILCPLGIWYATKLKLKEIREKLYIYPKNGHQYLPLFRCRLKCPASGQWFDAIIYKGIEDEKYYVRERKDFLDKFVKLKDWENGNSNK